MSAIRYAQRNHRVLVVDWTDGQFDRAGLNAFDRCFELKGVDYLSPQQVEPWNTMSHYAPLFQAHRDKGIYDLYLEYQNTFLQKIPARLLRLTGLQSWARYWKPLAKGARRLPFGEDLPNDLPQEVVYYVDFLPVLDYRALPGYVLLKPAIRQRLEDLSQEMNLSGAIGVHIRATDKRPARPVQLVIDHLKARHPGQPVYLATDSAEVEAMFREAFSGLRSLSKLKPDLKGEGLHQWALYQKQEDLKAVIFEESVLDMFLLSRCQTLYYQGNSTFSNISRVYHANPAHCHDWQRL